MMLKFKGATPQWIARHCTYLSIAEGMDSTSWVRKFSMVVVCVPVQVMYLVPYKFSAQNMLELLLE